MRINILLAPILLSTFLAIANSNEDDVFMWSSTGGGWRSMCACFGYASAFQQAGLFDQESSKFRSIATNSGASWFNTQLFYSQAFYDQVVMAPTPEHLYNFTLSWMNTYYELAIDYKSYLEDNITQVVTNVSDLEPPDDSDYNEEFSAITALVEVFDMYLAANASWGVFYFDMMTRATQAYGHEGDFASILATAENRLTPLQKTEMILQTTISPSSKVRLASANFNYTDTVVNYGDTDLDDEWSYLVPIFGDVDNQDMQVFLGPLRNEQVGDSEGTIDDWHVYSVGVSSYYLVNDTFEGFQYATHDSDSTSTMASYAAPTHQHFNWANFEGWYLYPNDGFWGQPTDPALSVKNATIPATYNPMSQNMTPTGTFRHAFGGGAADVIQAGAVSSAFAGTASPTAPPIFAQSLSLIRQQFIALLDPLVAVVGLTAFDLAVQNLYKNTLIDNGAVCSQWPEPCGPNDGYFMDGAFSDNPSVPSNIAQYQNSEDADLSKTIKLVLTNTNQNFTLDTYDTEQFTQYYETDFNQNITPGGYVWLPDFVTPYRSPQIFEEYLTSDDLGAAIEPIEESNITTAILKGTTIVNPAFGTEAGQNVEILLINTNEKATTFIAGVELIERLTPVLAELTVKISDNEILIGRIRDFFFGDEDGSDAPDGELAESPPTDEGTSGTEEEPPTTTEDDKPASDISRGPLESTSAASRQSGSVAAVVAVALALRKVQLLN